MFTNQSADRRQEEERVSKEGRLPPGQSLTLKFPVLHYGPVPHFNAATWQLRVWGEVEEDVEWTWDEFNHLPRTKIEMDIHCVTRWSKFDTIWEGVSVRTLIDEGFVQSQTQRHACYAARGIWLHGQSAHRGSPTGQLSNGDPLER